MIRHTVHMSEQSQVTVSPSWNESSTVMEFRELGADESSEGDMEDLDSVKALTEKLKLLKLLRMERATAGSPVD